MPIQVDLDKMKKLLLIAFLFLASCTYNYQLAGNPTLADVNYCIGQMEFARATHQRLLQRGCSNPDWQEHWVRVYDETIKVLESYKQVLNKEVKDETR